jgi:hypothetical protein
MHNAKPVSTPSAAHFILSLALCSESEHDIEYMSRVPYFSVVGSLMYAMVCSHPDLSHALSVVSRFMANPGKERWRDVRGFLDIYEVLLMPVSNLGNLEMDLLAMLILIMMVIWISGGLSYDIFSTLVVCVVS